MIRLVAFDLDGTIGDTIPLCLAAFREATTPYIDHELSDDEIARTFGLNEEGMINQVVSGDSREKALNDFYVIYEEMHAILCPKPFEGMKTLIGQLHERNVIVVLITGKGIRSCDITLKQFGMDGCFDRIETGSSEKNRKSEAMKDISLYSGFRSNEMIYVGDTVSDIEACYSVKIQCLSAAWAASTDCEQLEKYNSGYVFSSVRLLRDFLLC